MKRAATVISFLFHPLIVPTYAIILVILLNPYMFAEFEESQKRMFVIQVFINTFCFPLLVILLMIKLKFIKSIYIEDKRERMLPYFIVSFFVMWTFWVFKIQPVPVLLKLSLLGASIAVFLSFFVNIFMKVSMHTTGMGGLIALFVIMTYTSMFNLSLPLMIIILIAGVVGTARFILEAHEPAEVYGGYILGFMCQILALQYLAF